MDGQMDGWADRWTGRQADGLTHTLQEYRFALLQLKTIDALCCIDIILPVILTNDAERARTMKSPSRKYAFIFLGIVFF